MKISTVLSQVKTLYMDTAPLIYYVEANPVYVDRMEQIISIIEDAHIEAVSSAISLTEVLYQPMLKGRKDLEQAYRSILLAGQSFRLLPVSLSVAESAARLRARYNMRTPDALHVATAIDSKCDALLTNDKGLRRVAEITMLVMDDLEPDPPQSE